MATKCFLLFVVFSCSNGVLGCRPPTPPPAPPAPPPTTNCQVSGWHQWICRNCVKGQQKCERRRDIVIPPSSGGISCPRLSEAELRPCPVECRLDSWLNWSDCTTCGSGGRSRYRTVNQPAVFNGSPCTSTLEQVDGRCAANDTCDADSCNTDEFKCRNGNCLPHFLICNGDDDCGDNSDESTCGKINKTCSTDKPIPGILKAGRGYDILRDEYKRGIVDNTKYLGTCVIIHSNKVDQRKPWNIEDYDDQVDARQNLFTEGYSSSQEYRDALMEKFSASFSFFGELDELSASVSLSMSEETSRLIEDSASESSSFFHLEVEIHIASFTTRTRKLLLSRPFVDDIKQLPKHYDFAKYSRLFINYGTHYISIGTLGGKFKYVLQYSNEKISSLKDTKVLKHCLQVEILANFGPEGNAGTALQHCQKTFSSKNGSVLSFASKISVFVVGGSTLTATALALSDVHTPSRKDYQAWAQSISENPGITSFKLAPVTDLLPKDKREYGRQALVDYLKLYDPVNCKVSCLNNGKLVVLHGGKECHCVCPFPYYGLGCENGLNNAEFAGTP